MPCEDEGDDIYEDIIRVEVQQPMVTAQLCSHSYTSLGMGGRGLQEGKNSLLLAGDAAGKGIAELLLQTGMTAAHRGSTRSFPAQPVICRSWGGGRGKGDLISPKKRS